MDTLSSPSIKLVILPFEIYGLAFQSSIVSFNLVEMEECQGLRYYNILFQVMKFYLDQFFAKRNDTLEFYQRYDQTGGPELRGFNFYVDIFFLALGIATLSALIEENTKGLKFGLFMTGVRRSSYYLGTLFIPFFLATVYSLLVIIMSIDLWSNPASTGPLIVLVFTTSYAYIFFFLTLSQVVSTTRLAQLAITIFVGGGYVTN